MTFSQSHPNHRLVAVSVAAAVVVEYDWPDDPAAALADELRARDVAVPEDWAEAWTEDHVDAPEGAGVPLPARVGATLASRGVDAARNAARRAAVAAFDPAVTTRQGATDLLATATDPGPVAIVVDTPVPEVARRVLVRADVDRDAVDDAISPVGCGWEPTDPRLYETVASRLDVAVDDLIHVGVDGEQATAVREAGGRFVDASGRSLAAVAAELPQQDGSGSPSLSRDRDAKF